MHLTDAGREVAQRGQAILNEPPPALTDLDSDDLARLDEILTRLRTKKDRYEINNPDPSLLTWETPPMIRTLGTECVHFFLLDQDGEFTLIDAGLSGHGDTLQPDFSVFDRRLRGPGLPIRQA